MRVLITRPRQQAADFEGALRKVGAQAIFLPTIQIAPVTNTTRLDRALTQLQRYDWLVMTSANAVQVVFKRLEALGIDSLPTTLHIAAIGPKTAAVLKGKGCAPDYVPDEYIAEAILPGLGELRGRRVLLPVADIAQDTLPRAIQAAGGFPQVITTYHTIPAQPDPEGLAALQVGVDVITFTSGSSARNFVLLARQAGLDPFKLPGEPVIACIGPKTAEAAQAAGFKVGIVSEAYTVEGLTEAIKTRMIRNKNL